MRREIALAATSRRFAVEVARHRLPLADQTGRCWWHIIWLLCHEYTLFDNDRAGVVWNQFV